MLSSKVFWNENEIPIDAINYLRIENGIPFFQSINAYKIFGNSDGYNPGIILVCNKDQIVGSLLFVIIKNKGIKGHFSRRCIIWGEPYIADNGIINEILEKIIETLLKETNNKSIYIEFRIQNDLSDFQKVCLKYNFTFNDHLNILVPIESIEQTFKNVKESKRRQIKKSLKNGAAIIESTNKEEIKSFYNILLQLYRTKVKKPLPSLDFFLNLCKQKDYVKYFLIKYKDDIVGGIVCPIDNEKIYEWYICGLDNQFDDIYPSVLATWAPIEYAAKNGLKYFDFMGAGKPNEDYGVRKFKSDFGGNIINIGRYLFIGKKITYKLGEKYIKLRSKR